MALIENFEVSALTEKSRFITPFRIHYRKEGENAASVASAPHTPIGSDGKPIVLPTSLGETLELCAGIVDKADKSLEEIASIELHEECGYCIDPSRLRKITTVSASVGLSGTTATVFYVEVDDSDLDPSAGGGNPEEGEFIEVVYWPVTRSEELLTLTETSTPVSSFTVLAVLWFQRNILPNL